MSDDNNDKLMEQFIEKATPKLLEALAESVSKQIEDSIGGLKANSEKMLDELKDRKRAAADDLPRMAKLVARQRKVLSKFEFDVEHGLNWMGRGHQFFDSAAIAAAYTDTPQLMLGNLYAGV